MPMDLNNSEEVYSTNYKSISETMDTFCSSVMEPNQSYWYQGDLDSRFEAGDQGVMSELYNWSPNIQHKSFYFNRIRRVNNLISGHQRKNRKSIIVTPRENGDQQTSDQFSKVMSWVCNQAGVLETLSDGFHGSNIAGLNLLETWLDYRNDPVSGNIKVDNTFYNSFLIDPYFKKRDLSDCAGIFKRTYMAKEEAASLWPDYKNEIMKMSSSYKNNGKFQYMPESYERGPKNLIACDTFYYKTYRKQKMLIDAQNGINMEWSGKDDGLKLFLQEYPQIKVIDQEVPTVRIAIRINGEVIYDGPNPLGIDEYPFVPILSYFNPQLSEFSQRIQGVVRGLRDPQYLYNRRKVIEMDILESQINSGIIAKENSVVNPKSLYKTGQGQVIFVKQDAQLTDLQPIQPPQIPPSMFQLSELLGREIMEISGVNEELLGSAIDDKAGVLAMLRQDGGITTLQGLFDNLDYSTKLLGNLLIKVIQANFVPSKIARIIEEEPSQEFYSKTFGTYDAVVEEGFNTSTQRQLQFAQMLHLKEVGVPIQDEDLLEAATIQNKTKIVENMQRAKQEEQQQKQQQMQSEMQLQEANTKLANARATADEGLGIERLSRVSENQELAVERRAQAVENRASAAEKREQAVLNFVKAIKEIEDIDLNQLEKLIRLSQIVDTRQTVKNEQEENNVDINSPQDQNVSGLQGNLGLQGNPVSM
jgi:hypothetical protein